MASDKDQLYQSMAEHEDIKPLLDKLGTLHPVDEWSRALCLLRDCFAADAARRIESRREVVRMIRGREHLQKAYENAMVRAAPGATTFMEAVAKVSTADADRIREDYDRQINELMGRK